MKPDRTYSWLENGEQVNPAERFLLQTLVSRPSLFVRNGVAYAAIRRWRSSVKEYQIDALQAIKCSPSPDFVKTICDDFEQTLTQILGGNAYRYVVPVPCSRSGPECLSRQVARSLAARLQLPKRRALDIAPARGASHPKANLRRPPMRLREELCEPVLLVDDVATSGRHIEEAVKLLRQTCPVVLAVAWIGGAAER